MSESLSVNDAKKMRSVELRQELAARNLDTTGTKPRLLTRLLESLEFTAVREDLATQAAEQNLPQATAAPSLRDIIREEVRAALGNQAAAPVPPAAHAAAPPPPAHTAALPRQAPATPQDALPAPHLAAAVSPPMNPAGTALPDPQPNCRRSAYTTSAVHPPSVDDAAMELIRHGLADSSSATYASVQRSYERFAALRQVASYPVTEPSLINFLNWKFSSGSSGSSLKLYTQALRHQHVLQGLCLDVFASPRVRLLQQGALRSQTAVRKVLTAATLDDLAGVQHYLQSTVPSPHNRAMLWSAVTLAFHGLLRVSEYTFTARGAGLEYSDATMYPDRVELRLRVTKTSQYGSGQDISVRRTGSPTCPHTAATSYLAARGSAPGPLYRYDDGTPLKPHNINRLLQTALPNKDVRSHSLRRGAATLAGKAGVPEYVLKTAGRWQSSAYLRYVRTPVADRALPAALF
ncbi:uncharacterized protein LOC135818245 [Sycon ciliatum]|uniref:uncharacterized protein LOC135818245 n=1 Tax=Sycon ciliatum TaxID=27933 RepID=UPI0031F6ED9E